MPSRKDKKIGKHQSEPEGRIWQICSLLWARDRGRSPRRVWHGKRAGVSPIKATEFNFMWL